MALGIRIHNRISLSNNHISGSLTTQGLGVLFSTDELWPLNFFPNCVIALINILMFVPIYESPQFIMEKYGDVDMVRG